MCGLTETQTTDPTGHAWEADYTMDKAATCTTDGSRSIHCANCDAVKDSETIAALGHDYSVQKETVAPTASEQGYTVYQCSRCDAEEKRDYTPATGVEPPFIQGENGKQGWDAITDEMEDAIDSGERQTVTVDMNGTSVVPGDVLDKIKGTDVTIIFDMGDGITWSVDGQSITSDSIGDIDFAVTKGSDAIPVDVINNVTGERYSMNITLAYDGEFGFTAVLTINMEPKNAGYYANLFYYNRETAGLDFICADLIDADGNTNLAFTHASDYTIVINDTPMDGSADTDTADESQETPEIEATQETTDTTTPNTGDDTSVAPYVILLMLDVVGMLILLENHKRRGRK